METFYQDQTTSIYCGNALEVLKSLPDESAQMTMTSPPYWGLRNYAGGADIVWGNNENCRHEWGDGITVKRGHPGEKSTLVGSQTAALSKSANNQGSFCSICGAWRGQLGLEPTPGLYVEHLMMVFREVKRVLKKDGSFYLNIGDTYVSGKGSCFNPGGGARSWQAWKDRKANYPTGRDAPNRMYQGISPKCMACIPERLLSAMIEDGWILRNKIVWHKPNPMPSSVKDRFTQTWEYLYYFTKNNKAILWRNRETGEWRDTKPTRDEKYPWGGMYQNPETGELSWTKIEGWVKLLPQWMAFDSYFDLDSVRVPHLSDRPSGNKERKIPFTHKGSLGHSIPWRPFNLQVRDVKRGKGGSTALNGEIRASKEEVDNYNYPEKHHGSSMNNQESLHRGRIYESKYLETDYGQPKQGFQRDHTIEKAREKSREDAQILFPNDPKKQQEYIDYIHDHQAHPNGKNPGDLWSITTRPSYICVCPQCETVFKRLLKVCPNCGTKGIVGHFAPYPEELCIDPIRASSRPSDVVLDCFAGGGTTGVAAKRLGRSTILIEVVKEYCIMARYKLQRVEYQPQLGELMVAELG